MTTATSTNGAPPLTREEIAARLTGEPLTEGYRPTLPQWCLEAEWLPQLYLLRDIELMLIHPMVRSALDYFKSGIAAVEFDVQALDPVVKEFVETLLQRYWDRGVPALQAGYEYGWIGAENLYEEDDDKVLQWTGVVQFSPRDVFLLTRDRHPVGVRVKNVEQTQSKDGSGVVDLWLASKTIPAKGLWYAHQPRYNNYYGQSQLFGAWRPWRRLAWKDGAETVADTGVYRFAYAGPVIGYPEEDMQVSAVAGSPATTLDSQGRPRRFARDVARQIAELFKAGAGIGIPTSPYPNDMGGGPKWTATFPNSVLNIDGLVSWIKHLWDQISYGVGVPPELLAASEGGSGYSGRKIPREAFLMRQQRIADALLLLFVNQVLRPLVHWNFGPQKWSATIKNILMSERKAMTGQEEGAQGQSQQQSGGQGLPQQSPTTGRPPGWHEARGIDNVPQPQQGPGQFSLAPLDLVAEVARRIALRARRAA